MRAPLLSLSLLEQFEARLARRAPDVLRQLGEQGATDEDIDRATDALDGHHLPSEAITWWRWRNPPAEVEIVPVLTFVPLETAVFARRVRLEMREDAADYAARHGAATLADPDLWWSPAWLPFIGPFQRDITCIDCAVSDGEPTPVRRIDWETVGNAHYDAPVSPSIGALVERWIALLDAGAYVRDHDSWQWFSVIASLSGDVPDTA